MADYSPAPSGLGDGGLSTPDEGLSTLDGGLLASDEGSSVSDGGVSAPDEALSASDEGSSLFDEDSSAPDGGVSTPLERCVRKDTLQICDECSLVTRDRSKMVLGSARARQITEQEEKESDHSLRMDWGFYGSQLRPGIAFRGIERLGSCQ
jgi:hypothetical protein